MILQTPTPHRRYRFGDFTLDLDKSLLMRDGEVVPLRNKVFEVLKYLVERHGRLVTKNELIEAVWPDVAVTDNSLTQCLTEIRRAFGEGSQELVRTVARRGYIFAAQIEETDAEFRRDSSKPPVLLGNFETLPGKAVHKAWYRRTLVWVAAALLVPMAVASGLLLRPSPPVSSLAILPFHPLDQSDDEERYLELGMADSLITRLSLVRGLSVRPWASMRMYARSEKDPVALGREMKVASVLDGSLQRSDDRLRVTVRLYRVSDGKLLWADKFDEPYGDIFKVQDSISERVARALSVELGRQPQPRVAPEAYEAYVRGRYFFELFTKEGNQKAKEYFEQAIKIEPNFALAHAGLAINYGPMHVRGFIPPLEDLDKQENAARRALALDDSLAEAHLGMFTLSVDKGEFANAERYVKRATELNPNYLHAWGFYAFLLNALGRHEEALTASLRAQEIDPVSDYASKDLSNSLRMVGRYQEALEQARKAVELRPDFIPARQALGMAYLELNQPEEAYRQFKLSGDEVSAALARARQGERGPARELLEKLKHQPRFAHQSAVLYGVLGEKEHALDALEDAYKQQLPAVWLGLDSRLGSLRDEPRFKSLLARAHLAAE